MPRIRTIKPEFWSDSIVAELDFFTRLFYIGLWNFADDAGRGRAKAKEINGALFPHDDDVENRQVEEALQNLASKGRIVLYEADGQRYFQIVHWKKHQVINRPSKSSIPAPDGFHEDAEDTHGAITETSVNEQGAFNTSRVHVGGGSGKGNGNGKAEAEGESEGVSLRSAPPAAPLFVASNDSALPLPRFVLSNAETNDLLASGPPGGSHWTLLEIDIGCQILAEREGKPPRDAKALLHTSILPEVRGGRRPKALAHAPPKRPPRPEPDQRTIEANRERMRAALAENGRSP